VNWINSLNGLQWMLLGLIPPLIVLLYFLKLRRTPMEVPSTYLWLKTIEDLHVNSIWQRLRNNLLLFLQLLAVLLVMLAVLRPGCEGEQLIGERFIFVIDQSASMSATDAPDRTTRLERAKQQTISLIDRMKRDDSAMVISFSNRAVVQQSYTKNKSLLKRKVSEIQQTERGSDLNEALLAASGLANPGRTSDRENFIDVQVAEALEATLYLFSDGAVKEVPRFSLGNLSAEYRPIGADEPPPNIGITAFSLNDQIEIGEQVQVFARLQNSGMEDAFVNLELYVNNQLRDAKAQVKVPGLGSTSLNFDLTDLMAGLEEPTPIRLQIENEDVYMQDNVAYCVLNPPRLVNALIVTDYNQYLQLVMKTERVSKLAQVQFENRSYLKDKTYLERATLGYYDLIIFDQCAPETPPACNAVYWAAVPRGGSWKTNENLEVTPITDVDSAHPLMYAVVMGEVNILSSQTLAGPQGSIALIESPKGPVMMIGPREGYEDLVIGFPLLEYSASGAITNNSDWPRKLSFPLFIQNLLTYLGGGARLSASKNYSPGELVTIKTQFPASEIEVKDPAGIITRIKPRADGNFVFSQTERTGIYDVIPVGGQKVDQRFAVNLLDRLESDLAVRSDLKLGFNTVEGKTEIEPARKEFWPWVVLLVLAVVLIEWVIYNRRVLI
jgi:hypothetical protein